QSKWSLSRKVKLLVDSLVSFSYAPIRLTSLAGACVSLLGLAYALVVVVNALRGQGVEGWSVLLVAVLLLGGFQLLALGILGEYLRRAFDEARGRPRCVIEEQVGPAAGGRPAAGAGPGPAGGGGPGGGGPPGGGRPPRC